MRKSYPGHEDKVPIQIVLIGHKDHGKSTLIGRLLLDTKSVKPSKVKEIKEADRTLGKKFELAHLVDSFREEREREMTMDTTGVLLSGKMKKYQLIDVPGHQELISQMLTGASTAEIAILVVSITEGVKEQTKQHLEIARLLGIKKVMVAINKIDEVGYREDLFRDLADKLKRVFEDIKYQIKDVHFFPISAMKGENVARISSKTSWYSGSSLLHFLEKKIKNERLFKNSPLRFLVQDKYSDEGGEFLVGRLESGHLRAGQKLVFLPGKQTNKIVSIRDFEKKVKMAREGQNIGLVLKGKTNASRGSIGFLSGNSPRVSNVLSAEIFWVEDPLNSRLILECGSSQVEIMSFRNISSRGRSLSKFILKKSIVFDDLGKSILRKIIIKRKGKIIGFGNIINEKKA